MMSALPPKADIRLQRAGMSALGHIAGLYALQQLMPRYARACLQLGGLRTRTDQNQTLNAVL